MRDPELDGGIDSPQSPPDDTDIAELLRSAGRRDAPPAEFERELRASLHAEWRAGVARRHAVRRRWTVTGALAAALALLALGVDFWAPREPASHLAGHVERVDGTLSRITEDARVVALAVGERIAVGERLVTGTSGRAAILLPDGESLRLDRGTEVRFESGGSVQLARGAVYVDAGREIGSGDALVIDTAYGAVRHLGTQYEVHIRDEGLRVSVREGRVEVIRRDASLLGSAGERLFVSRSGDVNRSTIAPDAADWHWPALVAPEFTIDNRTLSEFLAWAGRELGRDVVFASPQLETEAASVVLRGSIFGLPPDRALDAVLATTKFAAQRSDGRITIHVRD